MSIKKRSILAVIGTFVFSACVAIFLLLAFGRKSGVPKVALLELRNVNVLTVGYESGLTEEDSESETILFCVNKEMKPGSCSWQEDNHFVLDEEREYYIYVKSIHDEKELVSDSKSFRYKAIDYSSLQE